MSLEFTFIRTARVVPSSPLISIYQAKTHRAVFTIVGGPTGYMGSAMVSLEEWESPLYETYQEAELENNP